MFSPYSSTMSAFDFIKLPLQTIREFLAGYSIELKETIFPHIYLVKFTDTTNVNDPVICRLKGLIFNHETGKIVSMTYPVMIDVKEGIDIKDVTKLPYTVQEALDGTLLRYSYFDEREQWMLSTINKEDASDAYWLSKESFLEQFNSVDVKIDTSSFDQKHVHLFILRHPHNINVVVCDKASIYHVATYDRTTQLEIECDLGVPKPPTLDITADQLPQLASAAAGKPVKSAGYLLVVSDEKNITHRYRFEAANYTVAKKLRGNGNNIDFLMLNLWQTSQLSEFHKYYPMYIKQWEKLYERFTQLTRKLFKEYGMKHKQHIFTRVHPRHASFMIELHQKLYLEILRPKSKTLDLQNIGAYLTKQPTAKLLYLLNYIYDEQLPTV